MAAISGESSKLAGKFGSRGMPQFRTIDDLDVAGKRVLLRADLNVPVKDGR